MPQLDTDALRRALRTRGGDGGPAEDADVPLDVPAIISRGRGLRRRRRSIAVAGGACAAAAVFGLATGISQLVLQPAGSHPPAVSPVTARHSTLPGGRGPTPRPSTGSGGPATPTPVPTTSPTGMASPTAMPSPTRSVQSEPTPSTSVSPLSTATGSPTGAQPTGTPTSSPTAVPSGQAAGATPTAKATATVR